MTDTGPNNKFISRDNRIKQNKLQWSSLFITHKEKTRGFFQSRDPKNLPLY